MTITNKLNRFVENTIGNFQEVSYEKAPFQCMDLAYEWVFCLDIPKSTIQHLYAYEVFTKPNDLTREYFEIIPNTKSFIPQDGDLAVYKGGEAGHIAIALGGGNTSKFLQYEQNKPLGTNPHIGESNYANCLGFLRPKVMAIPEPLKWLTGMFLELGIDLNKSEGEVRGRVQEVIDGYKKYGELEKRLQRAEKELAGAKAEATGFEERLIQAEGTISRLNKETADLRDSVASRDTEISGLKTEVESLKAQIDPEKVIVITRDEYSRLTAKKTLDRFTAWELFKEIFRRGVSIWQKK